MGGQRNRTRARATARLSANLSDRPLSSLTFTASAPARRSMHRSPRRRSVGPNRSCRGRHPHGAIAVVSDTHRARPHSEAAISKSEPPSRRYCRGEPLVRALLRPPPLRRRPDLAPVRRHRPGGDRGCAVEVCALGKMQAHRDDVDAAVVARSDESAHRVLLDARSGTLPASWGLRELPTYVAGAQEGLLMPPGAVLIGRGPGAESSTASSPSRSLPEIDTNDSPSPVTSPLPSCA